MTQRLTAFFVCLGIIFGAIAAPLAQAPTVFKKLDFYRQEGEEMKDHDAQLILDTQQRELVFADEDNAFAVFATVPWDRITSVSYENSKHARITAGLLVAWPLLFLSGKKHWLTVTYGPASDGSPGGYVFSRMDKDNFQAILAAINGLTGREVRRIEENGEISVLYPGVPSVEEIEPAAIAMQPTPTTQAAAPITSTPSASVPASALPPKPSNEIPAGPLPARVDSTQPLILLNNGVQWTTRTSTSVGYVWAAEVENPNDTAVNSSVILRLHDASGEVLHEVAQAIHVSAGETTSFTQEGEVAEAQAVLADRWLFDLGPATAAGSPTPDLPARNPGSVTPASSSSRPYTEIETVPLTEDVERPRLIVSSAQIILENEDLQRLDLKGKRITLRCLVLADGSVADARVMRVDPPLALRAAEDALKEGVRDSAIAYWRFTPAKKAGIAVAVWHLVTIDYQPSG